MKEWNRFCRENGRKPRRFSRDVSTRWNSTYEMLNESYAYKDLLCAFISNNIHQVNLYPQEWDVRKKKLDILKVFNDATYTLSGVYYPTTHLFLIECTNIVGVFDDNENDLDLIDTIRTMRTKWLSYYREIPIIYLVACVFDPRFKLDGLKEFLNTHYECLHLIDEINIMTIISRVKSVVIELYNEFCSKYNLGDSGSSQSSDMQGGNKSKVSRGYQLVLHRQKKQKGVGSNSEIESYLTVLFELDESEGSTEFSILDWWKGHSTQYPILALIAKQILATPCSTVAVEQTFSAGGNILDERRSRLAPESVEVQACVDDWTKAQYRQQEMDRDYEAEFFDNGGDTTGTGTGSD